MASSSNSSKQTSRIILMIAGLLVLTSMGYFAYQYFSEKQENKESTIQIERLNTEIFELEEKIYSFEVMLEDRKLDLATKNKELEAKKRELRQPRLPPHPEGGSDRSVPAGLPPARRPVRMPLRTLPPPGRLSRRESGDRPAGPPPAK